VAERRITSVLFGDLVGFTTLSENRDPEEVRELLSRYFAQCRVVVGRYGGIIEKFIGDAVMAVWGVPVAHEDDAERAVRAGLELVEMVTALGEEVGAPGLAMRVGVVTGEVAVTVGATNEGMVAGDAVNTASRVQSTAAPGEVWVNDATRSLTIAAVAYDDSGEHHLKGKAEPVRLFIARAVVAELGGGQRVDGLEAPHTGRDRDLRLLKELFHATEEAYRPRLVVVDGEAGVGKSRLVWEFEKYIDGLSTFTRWHRGRCLSYGDGVAFWALTEAVRSRLGVTESDPGEVVLERLDVVLDEYVTDAGEREWLRPRVAGLVGAGQSAGFARDDLFAAWTTFFERVGQGQHPVVLVVDDAHYADDGLLDFIEHLLETARAGIFVLAVSRPELLARRPGLGSRRATVIRLEPLIDDDMRRLVDGLVAGLPTDVRDELVHRAEGVPLFAVETVRALIDRDAIVPSDGRYVPAPGVDLDLSAIGAPASLQALVAARLDALLPEERRVVNDACVLGAVFTRDGVAALARVEPDVDIDAVLESLRRKEIVALQTDRLAADRGQLRFVQAVVRQVAYSTQSRRDRKHRHLAAANHLATVQDASDDLAIVIAQHLLDALGASATGDDDVEDIRVRACVELERAAARARGLAANGESLRLLTQAAALTDVPVARARLMEAAAESATFVGERDRALELALESASLYDDLSLPVRAGVVRGGAALLLLNMGRVDEAVELAEREWAKLADDPSADEARLSLCRALGSGHRMKGDVGRSTMYVEQRIILAERLGNYESLANAYNMLAIRFSMVGAPRTTLALVSLALEVSREHDIPGSIGGALVYLTTLQAPRDLAAAVDLAAEAEVMARRNGAREQIDIALANRSFILWTAGKLRDARRCADELVDVDSPLVAMAESARALVSWAAGDEVHLQRLQDVPSHPDFDVWNDAYKVIANLAAGNVQEAAAAAAPALDAALAALGIEDDFVHIWPWLVEAAVAAKDLPLAERLIEPVAAQPDRLLSPIVLAHRCRFDGVVGALRGDDPAQVEASLREGVARLQDFGAVLMSARAELELGRWLLDRGRSDEAEEQLTAARAQLREHGAIGWLRRAEAELPTAAVAP
jgi:class 3 adenylate cyclase/tetratricopeptide (TPR) repeat protein